MSEGFAEVEEGRLWYERAGGGFPVVFAHSGLGDARAWEMQFEAFAGQHEVVPYDRRGFGPPPAAVDRLGELRAAALLGVGEEDIAEVGEIADLVAERVPGASKRVIAEADQLVDVGKPERFNRLALDFLAFAG